MAKIEYFELNGSRIESAEINSDTLMKVHGKKVRLLTRNGTLLVGYSDVTDAKDTDTIAVACSFELDHGFGDIRRIPISEILLLQVMLNSEPGLGNKIDFSFNIVLKDIVEISHKSIEELDRDIAEYKEISSVLKDWVIM